MDSYSCSIYRSGVSLVVESVAFEARLFEETKAPEIVTCPGHMSLVTHVYLLKGFGPEHE